MNLLATTIQDTLMITSCSYDLDMGGGAGPPLKLMVPLAKNTSVGLSNPSEHCTNVLLISYKSQKKLCYHKSHVKTHIIMITNK